MSNPIPSRPTRSDPAIIDDAAHMLAADLARELNEDPDEIFADVRKALDENSHNPNGYRLAKSLDYMGWDMDASTVELLDGANSYIYTAVEKAGIAWVAAHQPPAPVIGSRAYLKGKEEQNGIGTILRVSPDGRATVCFPLLGHKPEGGTIGLVLTWESLTILQCCDEPRGLVGGPCDHCGNTVQPEQP